MWFFKKRKNWWRQLFAQLAEDKINYKAAAFAYYTLVALIPLLVLILFVGGFLVGEENIRDQIISYFSIRMGEQNVVFIENIVDQLNSETSILAVPVVFILISLFGIIKFFVHLRNAFFEIFDVILVGKQKEQKLYVTVVTFLTAMFFIILFTLIISSHVMTGIFERVFSFVLPPDHFGLFWKVFDLGIAFLITVTLLTVVYRMMSCYAISWRHSLEGALTGSLVFIVLNVILSVYFNSVSVGTFYGAGGAIVAFLLWVYSAGYVFFLGAEVAKLYRGDIVCKV